MADEKSIVPRYLYFLDKLYCGILQETEGGREGLLPSSGGKLPLVSITCYIGAGVKGDKYYKTRDLFGVRLVAPKPTNETLLLANNLQELTGDSD